MDDNDFRDIIDRNQIEVGTKDKYIGHIITMLYPNTPPMKVGVIQSDSGFDEAPYLEAGVTYPQPEGSYDCSY
ncbi:MAG: hypothetical protein CSA42_06620 [Gammaproteobacteria bacterium]|nr:MAG: hypothetical protein CSA42_06620 [Gammaproteobacteria bacterium]